VLQLAEIICNNRKNTLIALGQTARSTASDTDFLVKNCIQSASQPTRRWRRGMKNHSLAPLTGARLFFGLMRVMFVHLC
jgi:hypothetical protein